MFSHIRILDIQKTCAAGIAAARNLARASNADDTVFMKVAWDMAQIVAPVGSNPLGFILSPGVKNRSDDLGILWKPLKWIDDEVALEYALDGLGVQAFQAEQKLKSIVAGQIQEGLIGFVAPDRPERRWLWSQLTQLKYPGEPRPEWINEKWAHLAAFTSFHMGDATTFCSDVSKSCKKLSSFWRMFLRWHSGERGRKLVQLLKSVAASKVYSAGKRKTALLLLLWDATPIEYAERLSFVRKHTELLRQNIAYKGSPDLPVAGKSKFLRLPAEVLPEIEEAIQALKKNETDENKKRLQDLTGELLCARATIPPFKECLEQLINPELKVMLVGGNEYERIITQQLFAAYTGRTRKEWDEWSPTVARLRAVAIEIELAQSERGNEIGPVLQKLGMCTVLASDLERWNGQTLDVLIDLLPIKSHKHSKIGAVIATKADAPLPKDQVNQYRALKSRLNFVVNFEDETGPQEKDVLPDWIIFYDQLSLSEIKAFTGTARSTMNEKKKKNYDDMRIIRMIGRKTYVLKSWLSAHKLALEK